MRKILVLVLLLVLISVGIAGTQDADVDPEIYQELEENEKVKVIVVMKESERISLANEADIRKSVVKKLSRNEFKKKHEFSVISGFSGEVSKRGLEKLKDNPNVEKIYYDYPVKAFLTESVPLINADDVHNLQINNINITGEGETICIIDTGINYTHESLGGCTSEEFLDGNCSKVLDGYDFVNNDNNPMDDYGHGTHVAGIAAANGSIVGVAPGANIVAIKALNESGVGSVSDVIAGIDWCVNNASEFSISVISMSLGQQGYHNDTYCDSSFPLETTAINEAVGAGIFVTVASGNSEPYITGISSPACVENATSVGAVNDADSIIYQRGSILDLLAPGINIYSTLFTGGFGNKGGTSMATPHVAGAVALMQQFNKLEKNITLVPSEILGVLKNTGKQIEDANQSNLTFSRIDIWEAILELTKPIIEIISPSNDSVLGDAEVIFNVSIDDYNEVLNCSLFINNIWNETKDLADGDIFSVALIDGNYTSSVICYDNLSQSDESDLVEFRIDLTPPSVNVLNISNYIINNVVFTYNVSDVEVDSCSLIINNEVNDTTDTTIDLNTDLSFTELLYNEDYNWSVSCTDVVGWVGSSETIEMSVSCTPNCPAASSICSGTTDTRENGCGYSCNVVGTEDCEEEEEDTTTTTTTTSGGSSGGSSTTITTTSSTITVTGDAGDTKRFSFSKDVGLTGIDIKLRDAVSSAMIDIKKLDDKPSDVDALEDVVYNYVQIDATDITDSNIEEAVLKFKVDKVWLLAYDKDDVRLNRYNNGWKELGTVMISDDGSYTYYEAISPGFSVFAVTIKGGSLVLPGEEGEAGNESKEGLAAFTGFFGRALPEGVTDWIKNVNKYYWIGSLVFVGLLIVSVVYRKKIFSKAGEEEKEFEIDTKKKKKESKKEDKKKAKEMKLKDKKKQKIEKLKNRLEKLEGKEQVGFFDRVKSKFKREKQDVEKEKPEVEIEKEPEEKERGVFALIKRKEMKSKKGSKKQKKKIEKSIFSRIKRKIRGDVHEDKVKKILADSKTLKREKKVKEKPVEKSVKEEPVKEEKKRRFFGFVRDRIDAHKQRKQDLHNQFEFKDIKK